MDEHAQIYYLLYKEGLDPFYVSFIQYLKIKKIDDLLAVSLEALNSIGIVSVLDITRFTKISNLIKDLSFPQDDNKEIDDDYFTACHLTDIQHNDEIINLCLREKLGQGSYGTVYKAIWTKQKDVELQVAAKTLKTNEVEMWKSSSSLASLNHPNLIKFLGLSKVPDGHMLITEYAEYGSLYSQLKQRTVTSIASLCQFTVQAASALVYLHANRLVHRDISTRNMLLTAQNQIKVSDLGLSKLLADNTDEWVMSSSELLPMRWMSPESLRHGVFSQATDVWSFAVTLCEIFTFAEQPWSHLNDEEAKEKITGGGCLPEPNLCPEGFYPLIQQCFSLVPLQRPTFEQIRKQLIQNQPVLLLSQSACHGQRKLNFEENEFIVPIKRISDNEHGEWLGQHETTRLFGALSRSKCTLVKPELVAVNEKKSPSKIALCEKAATKSLAKEQSNSNIYSLITPPQKTFNKCDPLVQQSVNQQIIENMNEFLIAREKPSKQVSKHQQQQDAPYLVPIDVSTVKPSYESLIRDVDPFHWQNHHPSSNPLSRPSYNQELSRPSIQELSRPSNQELSRSCNQDTMKAAQQLNSNGNISPPTINSRKAGNEIVRPRPRGNSNHSCMQPRKVSSSPEQKIASPVHNNLPPCADQSMKTSPVTKNSPPASRSSFENLHSSIASDTNEIRERKRVEELSLNPNWLSFEECCQPNNKIEEMTSKSLSDNIRLIRDKIPDASVTECLEGLKRSQGNPHRAIDAIHVYKLSQLSFPYTYEHIRHVYITNACDFESARQTLSIQFVMERFRGAVDRATAHKSLAEHKWNIKTTLETLFIGACASFGVSRFAAFKFYQHSQEDVARALQTAKVARVCEITGKSEASCLRSLQKFNWKVGECVESLLST